MQSQSSPYYGDPTEDDSSDASASAPDDSQDTSNDGDGADTENQNEDDSETFLTPKGSVAGDVSPGDKMTFQCVKVYDDEVEWKPVKADSKAPKPAKMSASDEIDRMAAAQG